MERQEVAGGDRRHRPLTGEGIGGLADRPDHVHRRGPGAGRGRGHRHDLVPGVVEAGPQQIVHGGVHHQKRALGPGFDVEHPGHHDAGVADQDAAGLEHQLGVEAGGRLAHRRGVDVQIERRLVAVADA